MKQAQLPDGTILEFPDETADEVMDRVVKQHLGISAQQTPQENPTSPVGRTLLDQVLQGATFGFGDEITDALGAAGAGAVLGQNPIDLYKQGREATQNRIGTQLETRPVMSTLSQLGGALGTGGIGASTKTGGALANFARSGNVPTRIAKGVTTGALTGGLYGLGSGDDGNRLDTAKTGAAIGAATGGLFPAAEGIVKGTKIIGTGIKARSGSALDDTVSALKRKSSDTYKGTKGAGVIFNPDAKIKIVNNLDETLKNDGILNKGLHGNTMSVLDDFKKAIGEDDLTLEGLDQWRQLLGDVAGNFNNKPDARKAKLLIRTLDKTVDELGDGDLVSGSKEAVEALGKARSQWAKASRVETVSKVLKKAKGDPYKIKSGLSRLAENEKKVAGFNAKELEALAKASDSTLGEKALKGLGRFGIEPGNVYLPLVTGGLGSIGSAVGAATAPAALGLVGTGTVARQVNKYLARGKAENLLRILESRP